MKILIIVPGGIDPSGEKSVIPVLLNLYSLLSVKHEVIVLATAHHIELTEFRLAGCKVISLPKVRITKLISAYSIVKKRLSEIGFIPDVIHSFWLGVPSFLGALLAYLYKTPHLVSVGGGELVSIPQISYGGCQTFKDKLLMWVNLKICPHITLGSKYLRGRSVFEIKKTARVVPLGIDLNFWTLQDPMNASSGCWNILWLASINAVKNPWLMLGVAENLKKRGYTFDLHVVGIDTLRGEIQSRVNTMGIQANVHFYGYREQKEIPEIISHMHFILQTSDFESQGIAMAEAVSQGVCPVGTNVGWLNDMDFGVGIEADSLTQQIADEIVHLSTNADDRKQRVLDGQKWLISNDAAHTASQFENIYYTLLRNKLKA